MNDYPTLKFLVTYRRVIPPLVALLFPVLGAYLTMRFGYAEYVVFGLLLAPAIYVLVRSYVELVRVMADYLLPQG